MPLFETITDLAAGAETLRRRAYGVIEIIDGRLSQVRLRPFPKIISVPEIVLFGQRFHRHARGDRYWLYYNQPWRYPNFLVLKYVVSARETSFGSLVRALEVLDYIARLKRSDALLCDVGNWRISTKIACPLGLDAALPFALAPALHQTLLRRLSSAGKVDRGVDAARQSEIRDRLSAVGNQPVGCVKHTGKKIE